jgi:hypothetical protein
MFYDTSQLARTESPKIMEMMLLRSESVPWRQAVFHMLDSRRFKNTRILKTDD